MMVLTWIIMLLTIGLLADAVITVRKAQRSCEKIVTICEDAVRSLKDKGV